jgi:hypothetical protein
MLAIDPKVSVPIFTPINYINYGGDINFFESYDENFANRQVRTVEFPFIKNITSLNFMNI